MASGGRFWMADKVDGPLKIKFETIFNIVAGAADLLDNAAWAFSPQADDIIMPFCLGLLHMAFCRSVTGFTLHAITARFRVAPLGTRSGNKAIEPVGLGGVISFQGGMQG